MKETTASDIERINVAILILGSLITGMVMGDFKHFFSFAVGSAIMTMNFRLLRKIIESGFSNRDESKKGLIIKLPLKILALSGLVIVVVLWGDISAISFVLGLSTVFLSIVVNQVHSVFSPVARRRQKDGA